MASWKVDHASAVVVWRDGASVNSEKHGDTSRVQRIASVSKPMSAWAILIAVEEGTISLSDAVGQSGCTVEHLLAHAGGYPFFGAQPVSKPAVSRIYSNTGFDMLAEHLEHSAGMSFANYLREAVFEPLGMSNSYLDGSCGYAVHSNIDDAEKFVMEMRTPTLIARDTYVRAITPVFPSLSGMLPSIGSMDPCPWGLGVEIRGHKTPHWTSSRNSASTFGHFGGIGTFVWVDPVADIAVAMFAEREFNEWGMEYWPAFNDEVLRCLGR